MTGPVTSSVASGVTRADGEGRVVCAEGNPWNPDFTCAKDAGHDGDHWSPTGSDRPAPDDDGWPEWAARAIDPVVKQLIEEALAEQAAEIHARYEAVAQELSTMPPPGGYDGDPWDNGWDCARDLACERIRGAR